MQLEIESSFHLNSPKGESVKGVNSINIFLDWSFSRKTNRSKQIVVLVNDEEKFRKFQTLDDLLSWIESILGFKSNLMINFILERGSPRVSFKYKLAELGNVFEIPGKEVKDLRELKGLKKSDENDVLVLRELWNKDPNKFHKTEKEELWLRIQAKKYIHLDKDIVRLKNSNEAFKREYGEDFYLDEIKSLENKKKLLLNEVNPILRPILKEVNLKGLGPALMLQILALGDPRRFKSLSAFLAYWGLMASRRYKDPSKGYKKGNLINKGIRGKIIYQLGDCLVKQNDPLYKKLKEDIKERFPSDSKKAIDMKARNRLVTIRMKQIFKGIKEYFNKGESINILDSLESNIDLNSPVRMGEQSDRTLRSRLEFNCSLLPFLKGV